MSTEPKHTALSWDWKEQIDVGQLADVINEITEGRWRLYPVDTGTDEVGILISNDTRIHLSAVTDTFYTTLDTSTESDYFGEFPNVT